MTTTPPISKADALAAFGGSQTKLAQAVRVSRQAVHKTGATIPELWAYRLRYEVIPDAFDAKGRLVPRKSPSKPMKRVA